MNSLNDVQSKLVKFSNDYVSVLEEIADILKSLDDDLMENVLGRDKYDLYKKKQVERFSLFSYEFWLLFRRVFRAR